MNLKKVFFIFFVIQLVLIASLGVLTYFLFLNQTNLNKSQDVHFNSQQLADELRQSSDDLTRMARAFVETRNPEFEQEYMAVLDIRNGKIPRPINYDRIYWDFYSVTGQKPRPDGDAISLHELMVKQGFTKAEFEKLSDAQKNSDALAKTEAIAIHAVKGLFDDGKGNFTIRRKPEQEMADRIMNDKGYYKNKAAVMKPIDEFFVMFENRTASDVARYEKDSNKLLTGILLLIIIIIGTFVLSYKTIQRQISRRQVAEANQKIYRYTINSINDIVNIADLNDNLILVNPAFCKAYGYSEEELIGKHSSIFWSDRNPKEIVSEILPATLAGGWSGDLYNKKKDGTEFPINLSTAVIKDDSGNPIAVVGIVRDITKTKESELLKNSLFKISEAVNITSDIDSFYLRIYSVVKELMPAGNFYIALYDTNSDLISFPFFVDENDPPPQPRKSRRGCTEYVLRTGEPVIIDKASNFELQRTGNIEIVGTPAEVWLGVPLKISGNTIGVMVIQDYRDEKAFGDKEKQILVFVSEHVASAIYKKETEEKLKLYTEELLALNATKDKFFSIIAHDLKSPFIGFLGLTESMAEEAGSFSTDEITRVSNEMHLAAENLFNLLKNLLEWAQMQKSSMSFLPKNLNLSGLISENAGSLKKRGEQKGINVINAVSPTLQVFGDEKMLNSVLLNLISNALKYTNRNGTVTISAKKSDDNMTEISVNDTGIGMSKNESEKLFKVGQKVGSTGTDGELSTGLGLLLCKEFVEKNGGIIWAQSEEGKGSTFCFTISTSKETEIDN